MRQGGISRLKGQEYIQRRSELEGRKARGSEEGKGGGKGRTEEVDNLRCCVYYFPPSCH